MDKLTLQTRPLPLGQSDQLDRLHLPRSSSRTQYDSYIPLESRVVNTFQVPRSLYEGISYKRHTPYRRNKHTETEDAYSVLFFIFAVHIVDSGVDKSRAEGVVRAHNGNGTPRLISTVRFVI